MEKSSSEVSLLDIGFSTYSSFYPVFLNRGITTLDQVLDEKLMNDVLSHVRAGVREELIGFIDLIRCKYLNEPLESNYLLDLSLVSFMKELPTNFLKMGFNQKQARKLEWLIYLAFDQHDLEKTAKVIDFFKVMRQEKYVKIMKKDNMQGIIDVHVDEYEKEEKKPRGDSGDLVILKEKLEKLLEERNKMDMKIMLLQEKIQNFQNLEKDIKK